MTLARLGSALCWVFLLHQSISVALPVSVSTGTEIQARNTPYSDVNWLGALSPRTPVPAKGGRPPTTRPKPPKPAPGGHENTPSPGGSKTPTPGKNTTPAPGRHNTPGPAPGSSKSPAPGSNKSPAPGTDKTPAPGQHNTPAPPGTSSRETQPKYNQQQWNALTKEERLNSWRSDPSRIQNMATDSEKKAAVTKFKETVPLGSYLTDAEAKTWAESFDSAAPKDQQRVIREMKETLRGRVVKAGIQSDIWKLGN